MVCGRPPFTVASPQAVMAAHVTETPEPVTKHRSAASESLNVLIMRCLEKKAADRWQSAAELIPQLETMTTPSGGSTPTSTAPVAAVSSSGIQHHHPVRVAGLFGLASVAVLGVVYFLMMQLGLPDWVLPGAVALLVVGLPIVLFTGRAERHRAIAQTTGIALPSDMHAGVHKWLTWRNALLGGGLAFAALGVGVAVYMTMRVLGIGPVGTLMASGVIEEKERLVLAEFENRTSDSTLGSTVTELLRIGLAQSTVLRILEQAQLGDVLARMQRPSDTPVDRALAMEVAQREGLKAVVTGEILQVGTGYALSASLVSAYGEVLTAQQETAGDASEIIAAVGSLARKIRERIGESLRTVRRDPLERVTTSSLQSLRLYSQALQAENGGDDPRAVELLEEAVALDSTFAMAYRKIGVILGNNFEQADRMIEATTKAYELRDRLSERERYHTIGLYHIRVTEERERAIAAYRTLLEAFPDDYAATHNTGVLNGQLRNFAAAEEYYRQAVELDSTRALSYINLAGAQRSQRKYDEAGQTVAMLAQRYPDIPQLSDARINQALAKRDFASAEEQLRRLGEQQRGSLFWRADVSERLAYLTALQGRVAEAEQHWQDAMSATEQRDLSDEYLAKASRLSGAYSMLLGDPAQGLAVLEAALERYPLENMSPWNRPYYWLIWAYVQAGETTRARALLDELGSTRPVEINRGYERWYHRARGYVAGSEGRSDEALEAFKRFDQDASCYPCAVAALSRGFDLAGQADSALTYYEQYAEFAWRPLLWDYMELPVSYRRLGELYEEKGDREKAVDYYGRFVELWSDADPQLQPVVEDVRGRIARLVGER
jgi:tetratricopeptide (TPR) repeat protein